MSRKKRGPCFASSQSTGPTGLGLETLLQNCSFVKRFNSSFPTGDSEQREAACRLIRSRDFIFFSLSVERGGDLSFRRTSCSWEKIKQIISIQICLSFEKGSKIINFSPSPQKGQEDAVYCVQSRRQTDTKRHATQRNRMQPERSTLSHDGGGLGSVVGLGPGAAGRPQMPAA